MKRTLSVCALVAVLGGPLSAIGEPPALVWSYASSDHFELLLAGKEKAARDAIAAFEGYLAFFEQFFKVQSGWRPRTRLVIFANHRDYALYSPRANVEAYWLGTPDGDFIVMESFDENAPIHAVHEMAHLTMARTGASYPLWLHEGLAQYFSTLKMAGTKVRLGLGLTSAMDALRQSAALMPLDRLFSIEGALPEGASAPLEAAFYATSWGLVHMLMSHEQYRGRAPSLLSAIAGGPPSAGALSSFYGKSVAAVSADLRRYVSRFKVGSALVNAAPAPSNLRIVSAAAADDIDAAVTLGSVLGWQRGHEDEGRAVLAALERDAPDYLRLAEARGLLEYYTQQCGPARHYLEKAAGLGSTNPNVLRAAANLIAPTDPERIKALLSKAAGTAAPMTASGPIIAMTPCAGG